MFDPINFLGLCDRLKNICNNDQSIIRTIIGRAYYSTFLKSKKWLYGKGILFKNNAEDHSIIADKLKHSYRHLAIGDKFIKLQKLRKLADYDIEIDLPECDAIESIEIAKEITGKTI